MNHKENNPTIESWLEQYPIQFAHGYCIISSISPKEEKFVFKRTTSFSNIWKQIAIVNKSSNEIENVIFENTSFVTEEIIAIGSASSNWDLKGYTENDFFIERL